MKVPLVDLVAQYRSIADDIDRAIRTVLESGIFILGPNVQAFEREVAAWVGVRHAVGVASGTDALLLTLRAFGIGPGDEVIVPAYTFVATAETVSLVGATPVFVDIDPHTYCLDVRQLEGLVSPRTKAIIPVHLYGHPSDMTPMLELARRRGLKVIEDNAQALGASYGAHKTGGLGDASCLSFFPSKNLGAYGDGGMVLTDDDAVAEAIRRLRAHGGRTKYEPETLGFNSRLDELQAAILHVKLRHLPAWNERRRAIAATYRTLLQGEDLVLPSEAPSVTHIYHLYVVRVPKRDIVQRHLAAKGIASGVYYPVPLHRLKVYRDTALANGSFPESERASRETLAIPIYPEMGEHEIEAVAGALREALGAR